MDIYLTKGRRMDLTELYKRLGSLINIRENIRREIISAQTGSDCDSEYSAPRVQALDDEYNLVQQQIIEIDREIREIELARAGVRDR